jgi:hypothetical protein
MCVKNLIKHLTIIVNINIVVVELKKIQTLDGQKEMVHYGLSTLKKTIRPGSLTIREQKEILPGVILQEVLTKVLNRNRIFVVLTNNNPYQVCLKTSMVLGETKDIEAKLLPVDEAKISSFNINATGVISKCSAEKDNI